MAVATHMPSPPFTPRKTYNILQCLPFIRLDHLHGRRIPNRPRCTLNSQTAQRHRATKPNKALHLLAWESDKKKKRERASADAVQNPRSGEMP